MLEDLRGKTIIVTGGAQGIGKGIALHLLRLGAAVLIADLDEEAGMETASECAAWGEVRFVQTDVADEASVARMAAEAAAWRGAIDGLVNNAGIADPGATPVEQLSLDAWNRVLAVNLTGAFLCVKHAAPHLRRARGAVVNIASTRALQSEPNTEAYSASKGGLLALTHALAISLGPEVRVNAISPGWIEVSAWKKAGQRRTPALRPIDHAQHPVGRVGAPEDVAAMAAFLLSEASGFVTGQNFVVDGGMTRKMIYVE
ncbi:SDR family oxidoreductase [Caldilinea sp.]|jgi:NAD(P)-dependent dehydrogenase (short-subunit alcohol dehydrogenase family)|uniref:SDR family oxidoreductase n=1 Tax=Caldilinea sp. TaxID=2293560 RepID=UPI0021DCA5C0|nr:SDR family oxidoreductase [Caldilinea sp.]GIV69828.1 MAG: oxidoreductase [Caldilinea sp.]